ncbi:amino acid adenylation domain-containing protein, partial [Kitasatospora sp. NPDC050463]|uniref:amino acid adenylation domain-containing protein n=1 Tax=Kitasatospora sp. NPDC050463 TaxID=3155786 RepID=UPI0033DC438F
MNTGDMKSTKQDVAAQREELLRRRLAGKRGGRRSLITTVDRDQPLPVTFGQQQMWFLNRLEPDSAEYLVPLALRLDGTLDRAALRAAWTEIVARHEILRTRYVLAGEEPVQIVDAPAAPPFPVVDLADVPAQDREARARELAEHEIVTPFDLEHDWPVRARLIALAEDRHILVVTFHHIACDAWSMGVFAEELGALYAAFTTGAPSPLAPLPVQFADFAAWQRKELSGAVLDRQLDYWRDQLSGVPVVDLPTDRPRPARRDSAGDAVTFTIPAELAERAQQVATENEVTRFVVLLTAFQSLISCYTRTTDIPVGVTVSGRGRPELQRLIGYGINVVVNRLGWQGDPTFRELLATGRRTILDAYEHQSVPFARLVDELQPERDLSRTPLYQVDFILRENQAPTFELPGLTVRPESADRVAKVDLTLDITDSTSGPLEARLCFATALFDRSTVERMAAHYVNLLTGLTAAPDARLGEIDFVPAAERELLLGAWNETVEEPVEECVHELFAAQAARTPDAVALTSGELTLTYAELDERANRIAHHLIALGAGPERIVGLSLERGPDLIPALLGILKSGAAYLPLDPANPADRLAYMLADAKAELLVTHSALDELEFTGTRVLVDTHQDEIAAHPATAPVTGVRPDNLIYVIYTSGSTGLPKGVSLTHTNVARLFTATRGQVGFTEGDVWALFHSYAFDVSVFEMWGALLHGGRLVVVPSAVARTPQDMADLLVREQVSMLCQTPSAFRSLAATVIDDAVQGLALRTVIFAGERLDVPELADWTARFGWTNPTLVNMYGPTETSVYATFHQVAAAELTGPRRSVIGHHLTDLTIHLLDRAGRPVPIGIPGELHVGGPGVARGYLDRPELTAERFIPNPYGPAGSRLYATGDLARFLPDGSIDYLGRIDNQIKLRGYRIELGEIEAALSGHPGVRQAVVTVRDEALVAYVVPTDDSADTTALRAHLAGMLPEYMVPAAFVTIDAIPLNSSGKTDRRALPAPDLGAFTTGGYIAPRTPLEERLAAIWANVLGLPQVGVEDSFFDLGGDSIRAVRLVGAMREAGYDVSIRDVFEQRTIAAVATALPGVGTGESLITAVQPFALISEDDRTALPADVVDAYPLSQVQTGMLIETLSATDGRNVYQNITSFRLPDRQAFSADALRGAVELVTARHETLRSSMHLDGFSQPLQLVHATAGIPVAVHDLRGSTTEQRTEHGRAFAAAENAAAFELTAAPLIRIAAHLESDESWYLTLTYPHAITDGWSVNSMLMELLGDYQALRDGREPAGQAPVPVRYADFIAAEQDALADPATQEFWQQVVDTHSPLTLPATWGGEPGGRTGLRVPFADLEDGLRRLAAEAKTSVKSVLLSAHLKVMGSLTSEDAFHTGVVYHGRLEAPGADRVLGMHLNTLPFPAGRGARTWRELVERTYATESAIWSHRRYPLPAIQRAADSADGLINVMFDFHDFHQLDADVVDTAAELRESANEFGLSVITRDGHFNLSSATETFGAASLERLGAMYRSVLEAMAGDPEGDARAVHLP